jgi:hypothetical protein
MFLITSGVDDSSFADVKIKALMENYNLHGENYTLDCFYCYGFKEVH